VRNPSQTIIQPDGTRLNVVAHGDEWQNWLTDLEGHLLVQDAEGYYRQATEAQLADFEQQQALAEKQREQINSSRRERLTQRMGLARSASATNTTKTTLFPTLGKVKIIVALVEYQDVKFTIENPLEEYTNWLNQERYSSGDGYYSHYGSVRDYFVENSCGAFEPEFTVVGPLTLKRERSYYGENVSGSSSNDKRAHEMIIEACEQLDSLGFDFSEYDSDDNGMIDAVCVIYAGEGANAGGLKDAVWPHQWDIISATNKTYTFGGKQLMAYECTNEIYGGVMDGIGTFCHEFSHLLDLPDLYKTSSPTTSACTPKNYSVLDRGCYIQNGDWPCGYSAFERLSLGWMEPELLESETKIDVTLTNLQQSNKAYYIPIERQYYDSSEPFKGEYFLFENRQKCAWDKYLEGHGMLIWHIDFVGDRWNNNTVNNWDNHQCVDLVEADGKKKRGTTYIQDGSAPFPGTAYHTEFSQRTTPAFAGWTLPGTQNSVQTNFIYKPLSNIRESADPDDPSISLLKFTFMDPDIVSVGIEQVHADNVTNRRRIVWREGRMVIETDDGERMTLFGTK